VVGQSKSGCASMHSNTHVQSSQNQSVVGHVHVINLNDTSVNTQKNTDSSVIIWRLWHRAAQKQTSFLLTPHNTRPHRKSDNLHNAISIAKSQRFGVMHLNEFTQTYHLHLQSNFLHQW